MSLQIGGSQNKAYSLRKSLGRAILQVKATSQVPSELKNMIDPVTKEWLASNTDPVFGFPSVVRFSWSTAANILSSDTLTVKWLVAPR